MKHECPVCHKIIETSTAEKSRDLKSFPFCCEKCKLIDLGAWLDSEYKIFSELQLQDIDESSNISLGSPTAANNQ